MAKERAMVTAYGKTRSVRAWSAETGIPRTTISRRIAAGVPPELAIQPGRRQKRREAAGAPGTPGAQSWTTLEWDEDPYAQAVVREFGALTCVQVAALFGMSKQAISQIEHGAMKKLRAGLEAERRIKGEL